MTTYRTTTFEKDPRETTPWQDDHFLPDIDYLR
jgi:hypothetical protein